MNYDMHADTFLCFITSAGISLLLLFVGGSAHLFGLVESRGAFDAVIISMTGAFLLFAIYKLILLFRMDKEDVNNG